MFCNVFTIESSCIQQYIKFILIWVQQNTKIIMVQQIKRHRPWSTLSSGLEWHFNGHRHEVFQRWPSDVNKNSDSWYQHGAPRSHCYASTAPDDVPTWTGRACSASAPALWSSWRRPGSSSAGGSSHSRTWLEGSRSRCARCRFYPRTTGSPRWHRLQDEEKHKGYRVATC